MQMHRIRTRGRLETCRGHVSTRGGLRRSAGRIPHSPPKKMFSPSGGNFFCRYTGFEPEGKNKAGVVDSCFIVSLRRERFTGRSAQFLPAPCFRRSLLRFADDAADSLRQSPRINSETGLAKRAAVRSETGKQILRCGLRRITIPKTPREHAWRLSQ